MTSIFPNSVLHELRSAELSAAKIHLPAGARILELGGGDGFQASVLTSWGFDVSSVDVAQSRGGHFHFPVTLYDGVHLPFPDASFDVIFSSNVLEHVLHLDLLLRDSWRVLRIDGRAVHVVPSPAWRFWSLVTYYPGLAKSAMRIFQNQRNALPAVTNESFPSAASTLKALVPSAHGAHGTAAQELWSYRISRWKRVFVDARFTVVKVFPAGIFYTGDLLFERMPLSRRRGLARILGSACNVFVLQPAVLPVSEPPR